MKITILAVSLLMPIISFTGCSGVSSNYSTFEQQTRVVMADMILMLEQGKGMEMVEKYLAPQDIEREGIASIRAEFNQEKQDKLLKALRIAENITPTIDSKTLTVSYGEIDLPESKALVFQKINGKWYLRN
jgi:hypothetical protein